MLTDPENGAQVDHKSFTHGLISIFWKTTEDSNPQIEKSIIPESVNIFTANNVISYFRLAENRVHATTTAADFGVTKIIIFENNNN